MVADDYHVPSPLFIRIFLGFRDVAENILSKVEVSIMDAVETLAYGGLVGRVGDVGCIAEMLAQFFVSSAAKIDITVLNLFLFSLLY